MSEKQHMDEHCKELCNRLSEYIDGEIDDADCEKIAAHLKGCEKCITHIETLKKTKELCSHLKDKKVPETLSAKLDDFIRGCK